jgi:hypothetical protein
MKIIITKDDALEAWNNSKMKVLFEITFGTFDNYWKECEKFNSMTEEEQEMYKEDAIEKLAKSFTDYKKWGREKKR